MNLQEFAECYNAYVDKWNAHETNGTWQPEDMEFGHLSFGKKRTWIVRHRPTNTVYHLTFTRDTPNFGSGFFNFKRTKLDPSTVKHFKSKVIDICSNL